MQISSNRKSEICDFLDSPFWEITTVSEETLILYNQALTHDSFANEQIAKGVECEHYERLEFLGDRVLNLAVAEFSFKSFADAKEGKMTAKINFTENDHLAEVVKAKKIEIQTPLVRLGKGQQLQDSTIADVFEALCAAIYLDSNYGMDKIHELVRRHLAEDIRAFRTKNPKDRLQKYLQQKFKPKAMNKEILDYVVIEENQQIADNSTTFIMGVAIQGEIFAQGQGRNKAEAEQAAARAAIEKIDAE